MNPEEITKFNTPESQGAFCFHFVYIEILLSQPAILDDLNQDDIIYLMKKTLSVYEGKNKFPDKYSKYSLSTTSLLLGRILEITDASLYERLLPLGIKSFVENGYLPNKILVDQIVAVSKEYVDHL